MNFYLVQHWNALPPHTAAYPCAILWKDGWNDFGFTTLFRVRIFLEPGEPPFSLEHVKILQVGLNEDGGSTEIPNHFDALDNERFCSLGQTLEYYRLLSKIPRPIANEYLDAVNDVAVHPIRRPIFEREAAFTKSLLRSSEAVKALAEGGQLFLGEQTSVGDVEFGFTTRLMGFTADHVLHFRFSRSNTPLGRINVIIGKNGTGKTQYLSNLATALSQPNDKTLGHFLPQHPPVSRVIAISYSAFDRFRQPNTQGSRISYQYCGLRRDGSLNDPLGRLDEVEKSIRHIRKGGDFNLLRDAISQVITRSEAENLLDNRTSRESSYASLSAGQRILVGILCDLIGFVEEDSVVLLDEPETHLHPELLLSFIRTLHDILRRKNAFAIIATHAPLVIQQVPSRAAIVLRKFGSLPAPSGVAIECFGESLEEISRHVFDAAEAGRDYMATLQTLANEFTYSEILQRFDGRLSLSARAMIRTLQGQ